jgi:lipoprotein-releasing system ATP-binding protein
MNDDATPLIESRDLTKRFVHRGKTLTVLEEMNFRAYPGDRIAVMGPSGSGKSTLLQVIGTLDEPTSGTVLFDGKELFERGSSELASFRNREIGFVFQFHHLLPEFTALENVMLPGLIARMNRNKVEERAKHLLDQVGLAERFHHQPGELSGGEQQRVAIARALFMKPRLLMADEPTGNLDLKTGAGIHAVLRELNEETGVTVIVVTHDPRLAEEMPIKLVLDGGRLLPFEVGDPLIGDRLPEELLHVKSSNPSQLRVRAADGDEVADRMLNG